MWRGMGGTIVASDICNIDANRPENYHRSFLASILVILCIFSFHLVSFLANTGCLLLLVLSAPATRTIGLRCSSWASLVGLGEQVVVGLGEQVVVQSSFGHKPFVPSQERGQPSMGCAYWQEFPPHFQSFHRRRADLIILGKTVNRNATVSDTVWSIIVRGHDAVTCSDQNGVLLCC